MIYDPNNELTEEQLQELSEEDFFEYLDTKAEYLKQFTRPLGTYHAKRYAAMSATSLGKSITEEQYQAAKRIGKEGDDENTKRVVEKLSGDGIQ